MLTRRWQAAGMGGHFGAHGLGAGARGVGPPGAAPTTEGGRLGSHPAHD
jgi:hypothetical protein